MPAEMTGQLPDVCRPCDGMHACARALQAVRKRSVMARDVLPEEVFTRLRGVLFFSANFLVTRNKLTFRDNLQELLAAATPGRARRSHASNQLHGIFFFCLQWTFYRQRSQIPSPAADIRTKDQGQNQDCLSLSLCFQQT